MELKEILELKQELDENIQKLINDFQNRCHLKIKELEIIHKNNDVFVMGDKVPIGFDFTEKTIVCSVINIGEFNKEK